MNREYKIMKHSYWDEYGVEGRTYYSIRESRKFLGIPYWKDITHQICGMGDCFNIRTEFKTLEEADKFIKEKLCPRVGVDKWTEIEVKQVSC
jgi:hypothetical protein